MALVNKPDESIFASSAKQGEVDNFPDLLRGWGVTFDQTQGIPPMEWFNFLFKRLDEKHTYLMQRGLPEWSATQDYTKGSCVQFDGVSYRALKDSKNNSPNESDSQYWVRWGFTLSEIARATLTQYGVTQLYTGYDSQREDLALTPKTAYQLKQLIDSNTRSLGNFIPNSKKSNAVNSNSADTVATSAAVKTAYDLANSKQSPATTLAGYGIGNFKIENFVGNVNTLQTDGIYAVAQASRSQNLPVAGNGCHIQVIAGGDGRWCRQIAYIAYSTDVYERHQTSYQTDSWSDWVKIDSLDKIPNSKKSSAVNSESEDNVATSKAVKTAYDKAIAAEELANTKWTAKSATESVAGILPISHKTDGTDKNKFASEYAVGEAAKKGLPLGAVVSFPRAVTNPVGFLRADGTTFNQQTFPDLYRVLGSNKLPDLTRSDVGMTAYFAVDNIPTGWIAFDEIATQVTEQRYPELYRHLVGKYSSIARVPKVADRFLRNAGNGLQVGQTQEDEFKRHVHKHIEINTASDPRFYNDKTFDYGSRDSTDRASLDIGTAMADPNKDNWWITPNINSNFATGGAETRPKSLILKLCIKAINSFDDVVFWIKSHGEVTNAGALDAGRLAQGLQDKADRNHTHTASQITDFNQATSQIINAAITYQKIGDFEIRKYPDGTMIQIYKKVNHKGTTYQWSELHQFNWAVSFVEKPMVWVSQSSDENTNNTNDNFHVATTINSFIKINNFKSSGAICAYWEWNQDGDGNNKSMNWDFLAIGRWK